MIFSFDQIKMRYLKRTSFIFRHGYGALLFLIPFSMLSLTATSGYSGISDPECIQNPQKFLEITDDLIERVECSVDPSFSTCAKIKGFARHRPFARNFSVIAANLDIPLALSTLHSHASFGTQTLVRKAANGAAARALPQAPVTNLEGLAVRGILRNALVSRGAASIAYLIASSTVFNVVGFAANYSETACSTPIDRYVDHERGSCKPFEGFSPKFLEFLQLDPAQQLEAVRDTPGLCEMVMRTWEKERKPRFENAQCLPGGGVSAQRNKIHFEFRANGRQLKSFHDASLGSTPPFNFGFIRYGEGGDPDAVCLQKAVMADTNECVSAMNILGYNQNGKARFFNYKSDTAPIVESAQSALESARALHCDIAEALACCTPNDGATPTAERCKDFGISLSTLSHPETHSFGVTQ